MVMHAHRDVSLGSGRAHDQGIQGKRLKTQPSFSFERGEAISEGHDMHGLAALI